MFFFLYTFKSLRRKKEGNDQYKWSQLNQLSQHICVENSAGFNLWFDTSALRFYITLLRFDFKTVEALF